jgi:hypothetical protein
VIFITIFPILVPVMFASPVAVGWYLSSREGYLVTHRRSADKGKKHHRVLGH